MFTVCRYCSIAAVVAALTACASTPPAGRKDLLDVVRPGVARAEIVLALGPPFASYERERIMAWAVGEDAGGYVLVSTLAAPGEPRPFARYQLVVVFGADGKVEKHALVEVHKP